MARGKASARNRFDVVIAGGGFVGRTLALALAKLAPQGFRIALIDAEPAEAKGAVAEDARALGAVGGDQEPPRRARSVAAACAQGSSHRSHRDHRQRAERGLAASFPRLRRGAQRRWRGRLHGRAWRLATRARRCRGERAGHRDSRLRASDRFQHRRICCGGEARDRRRDRSPPARRRRRQALCAPRARRHQMRRLVLSANRHRHHRGAREAPSRQGGAAFPALRPVRHPSPQRQPLVHRVDGGERARARPSWPPTRRASSTS